MFLANVGSVIQCSPRSVLLPVVNKPLAGGLTSGSNLRPKGGGQRSQLAASRKRRLALPTALGPRSSSWSNRMLPGILPSSYQASLAFDLPNSMWTASVSVTLRRKFRFLVHLNWILVGLFLLLLVFFPFSFCAHPLKVVFWSTPSPLALKCPPGSWLKPFSIAQGVRDRESLLGMENLWCACEYFHQSCKEDSSVPFYSWGNQGSVR